MSSEKGELPTWYALDHAPSDKGEANPTPGPHGPQLEPGDAQNIVLGAALLTQTAPPKPEPKQDEIPEDEVPKPKSEVWTEIGSDSNCFSPPGDTSQPVPAPTAIAYVPAPQPEAEHAPDIFDFGPPDDGVTTTTPKRDGTSPSSTRDIQGSQQWSVPAPTAIAYVPAPPLGSKDTEKPNPYRSASTRMRTSPLPYDNIESSNRLTRTFYDSDSLPVMRDPDSLAKATGIEMPLDPNHEAFQQRVSNRLRNQSERTESGSSILQKDGLNFIERFALERGMSDNLVERFLGEEGRIFMQNQGLLSDAEDLQYLAEKEAQGHQVQAGPTSSQDTATNSIPAVTHPTSQPQPTPQSSLNIINPPSHLSTLRVPQIVLSGATAGVAGVAAGIGERGLVGGALGGVSIALLTGFAQESWDKLSAKGRAVTSGLGSLATAIYLSDDLSISKLGVAVAASTVVAAGVVTASKIKEKLTPPQIETSNTDYRDKVDEQVDAAVEALNKQEPGSGDKWKQDSEDNGSLVRLTNYACDLHQTKGSIPQNLIKSFNNSPRERAFRAGKKIQEVMKWGKQQLTQPSAALKIGGLALITGEATAIASDKLNTLQATAFATIVGGAIYGGSKAKESYDKLDKTDKLLVKIIGGSACILAGIVGFAVWSKLGQSAPSKPKGTKATRIIHEATTSTSALKPKSQSTTVAEFIPKGSGSGSSAGEFIPTPTGRTAATATTKATEVATTVATELKPGAETTQRTAKAAEKSGQALQKGQELKFKVGMATEEEKLKRRIKTLSKGRKVLSDSEITNKAKKILTKRWKILNGPGAAENLPKLTPSVASRIGDNEILRELTTAA